MRFVDIMMGFPRLFIVLLAIGLGHTSIVTLIIVLALFSWMDIARIVRSEVLSKKELAYIKSARALGLHPIHILVKHVVPNILGPLIVSAVLLISTLIIVESSLSFLGLGVQAPNASWGNILTAGKIDPIGTWWISLSSGFIIILSVVGFNLIGEGIRKSTDYSHD
jgi:peptide/nickel transport system permease protein